MANEEIRYVHQPLLSPNYAPAVDASRRQPLDFYADSICCLQRLSSDVENVDRRCSINGRFRRTSIRGPVLQTASAGTPTVRWYVRTQGICIRILLQLAVVSMVTATDEAGLCFLPLA
jgi:hypothetical protein